MRKNKHTPNKALQRTSSIAAPVCLSLRSIFAHWGRNAGRR